MGATEILSLLLGLLSVFLAIFLSWRTERLVREEDRRAKELIHTMEQGTRELLERMDKRNEENAKRTQEMLERMEQRGEESAKRTQEILERMDQRHQETLERLGQIIERIDQRAEESARRDEEAKKRYEGLLYEIQETQRLTNALIKAEGEEVKALIKELLRESKA
ncbi:MAG: hypothetical protein ACPLPS_03885 [bacterium]